MGTFSVTTGRLSLLSEIEPIFVRGVRSADEVQVATETPNGVENVSVDDDLKSDEEKDEHVEENVPEEDDKTQGNE